MNLIHKLNPKDTALMVIDIQNDFCSPDGVLARRGLDISQIDSFIDKLIEVINLAKTKNILTIYTQQIYDKSKLNNLQKEQYDLDGKLITCDISTSGHEFYRIEPNADSVYIKYNYNIFSNSKLLNTLKKHKIKTIIITGVDTVYCVETAIRNGFDLGFKIVIPKDLVAGNPKHEKLNLKTFELVEKTYGVVTTLEEIKDILNRYYV